MSECVVKMEMPENCFVCPFRLCCSAYRAYSFSTSTRRVLPKPLDEGCNILAVLPEGHGRLIDADKFIAHLFAKWQNCEISNSEWCDIRQRVNKETTIVPAERSDHEAD